MPLGRPSHAISLGRTCPVLTLAVGTEQDLFRIWQSVFDVAKSLDFPEEAQVRIAMAAFRLAWSTVEREANGQVEIGLEEEEGRVLVWVKVSNDGERKQQPGAGRNGGGQKQSAAEGSRGLLEVRRMADRFESGSGGSGGDTVAAGFYLPGSPAVSVKELADSVATRVRFAAGSKRAQQLRRNAGEQQSLLKSVMLQQEELLELNERLAAASDAVPTPPAGSPGNNPGGLAGVATLCRVLIDALPQRVFLKDTSLKFVAANGAFAEDLGVRPEELAGHDDYGFFPREVAHDRQSEDLQVIRSGMVIEREELNVRHGQDRWVRTIRAPIRGETGQIDGLLGIGWDVTEDRQCRESLKEMAREWAQTFDAVDDPLWVLDNQRRIVRLNRAAERLLGCPASGLIGRRCCEVLHDSGNRTDACPFANVLAAGGTVEVDCEIGGRAVKVRVDAVQDAEGRITGAVNRVMAGGGETGLPESRSHPVSGAMPVDCTSVASVVWSEDLRVYGWSHAAAHLFGFQVAEVVERGLIDLILPAESREEVRCGLRQAMAARTPLQEERTCLTRDGRRIVCRWTHTPLIVGSRVVGLVSLVQDGAAASRGAEAPEREQVKSQQQARLAAIATLADGVAHEINNPISGIMNYAELICESAPEEGELHGLATEILRESERISAVVGNLLTFARRGPRAEAQRVRPEEVIWRVVSRIRPAVGSENVNLLVDVAGDLPSVGCPGRELELVLTALLTNGLDALNERYPARSPDKNLSLIAGRFERNGDPWVRIAVEDHGGGIAPEVAERIYEPFYTTKNRAKATGLGLSICLSVIEANAGALHMETEPGHFTRFLVEFPATGDAGA